MLLIPSRNKRRPWPGTCVCIKILSLSSGAVIVREKMPAIIPDINFFVPIFIVGEMSEDHSRSLFLVCSYIAKRVINKGVCKFFRKEMTY